MKLLNGKELAGYIQERQAKQVRALRQAHKVFPKLAIVLTVDDPVINLYVKMKQRYGQELQVDVDIHKVRQSEVPELLKKLNNDDSVHGIIVQLPLKDPSETDKIVALVAPEKDVDALGPQAKFTPATPLAILWLLAGYNIELKGKSVVLVGRGKLVGAPLEKLLKDSGVSVSVADKATPSLKDALIDADVIISATGSPGILFPDMFKQGAVVVDAGVASEDGKTVGDVAESVYERDDLTITPTKGGVGPLTVSALFDNVIQAARATVDTQND